MPMKRGFFEELKAESGFSEYIKCTCKKLVEEQ